MGIERASRSIGLRVGVDAQHDLRDLASIGAILIGVKHPYVVIACSSSYLVRAGPFGAISPTFASIRGGIEQPHRMKRGVGVWRAEAPCCGRQYIRPDHRDGKWKPILSSA
jgi:hypothetical protein